MTEKELYDNMREWRAFLRRHNANIFDALFKDIDYSLKEEYLNSIISDVAGFFGMDTPSIITYCDTLTRICQGSDDPSKYELYYNWQTMMENGINNRDAFTLCMVHELTHVYLNDTRFMLCRNERWCHELAADYMVGIYSVTTIITTGKYKYAVGHMPMTITHPKGEHRVAAVEYGRECRSRFYWPTVAMAMSGLPAFIYGRQKTLNKELEELLNDGDRISQ